MSTFQRLKTALTEWRRCERAEASAVLSAHHPDHIAVARKDEARALAALRAIVDSQPWFEIANEHIPPVSELDGTFPVVLYFDTDAERDEFVRMVKLAKPNLKERLL